MQLGAERTNTNWPASQKILFRFLFICLSFQTEPWTWAGAIRGVDVVMQYFHQLMDWVVDSCNRLFFHLPGNALAPANGSSDTSGGCPSFYFDLSVACIGCIIWRITGRKRNNYEIPSYWLRRIGGISFACMHFRMALSNSLASGCLFPITASWLPRLAISCLCVSHVIHRLFCAIPILLRSHGGDCRHVPALQENGNT